MSFRVVLILAATVAGELDELLEAELEEVALGRAALLVESALAFSPRAARFGILLAFPPLSMGRLVMILFVFVWDYNIGSPRPG
jgi:hypothetical protein